MFTMPPKQGHPPPPPAEHEEEECVSNKEVHAMMKAMSELFTKNQQSIDTIIKRVECSIAEIIDQVDALETGLPQMRLMRMTTTMLRRWRTRSPSTLHVDHHDGSTAMTSRCTKSFHALRIDQIGKVWVAALMVALINSTLIVMMFLLLKLSLPFLPSMVYMMLKLI
jgi:hypothetical protein